MSDAVLEERDGPVLTLIINRPEKRNPLALDLMRELTARLQAADDDSRVHVVVVGAAGPVFSAGHDLRELTGRDEAFYEEVFDACAELMLTIHGIAKPVIARVQGIATAAGCQLVAACDLALASDQARFATPGVKIGLFCTTPMVEVARVVGRKRAMEMLLTGDAIDAATAADWGLVNRVVAAEDLDTATAELAHRIASASPTTLGVGKRAFWENVDLTLPAAYRHASETMCRNALEDDAQEGMAAFLEKRSPGLERAMTDDPGVIDCLVVGAGLAGLTCALRLARAGQSVTVIEAGPIGGRTRSRMVEDRPIDRGFQVLFSAYPATRRLMEDIGFGEGELRPFSRSIAIFDGSVTRVVGTNPVALLKLPGVTTRDLLNLGRVVAESAAARAEALLAGPQMNQGTGEYLQSRGVSLGAIEALIRPFFGVVFLDRSLETDAGYFRYLCHMMARGASVLPAEGLGAIAERAATAVTAAGGEILTGDAVASLERDGTGRTLSGVRLSSGRVVLARSVVLATDAASARALLGPVDPVAMDRIPAQPASVRTAAYLLDVPLYRGRSIVVNAEEQPARGRVDLLCQTSNVTNPEAAAPHVLLATRVMTGTGPSDADDLPDAVERFVGRLSPRFPWRTAARLIEVVDHPAAQWRPLTGARGNLPGPRTAVRNLVLAGDLTTHPSIEGAVVSGERAASAVVDLP